MQMATEPTDKLDTGTESGLDADGQTQHLSSVSQGNEAEDDSAAQALDELEAEELEMLTDDESDETLVVDEAAEMRAIRRAEIAMEAESVDAASADEFVCSVCFLVKRTSQLANKRKKICLDCAS